VVVDELERLEVEGERLVGPGGEAEGAFERVAGEEVDFAAEGEVAAFAEEVEGGVGVVRRG